MKREIQKKKKKKPNKKLYLFSSSYDQMFFIESSAFLLDIIWETASKYLVCLILYLRLGSLFSSKIILLKCHFAMGIGNRINQNFENGYNQNLIDRFYSKTKPPQTTFV